MARRQFVDFVRQDHLEQSEHAGGHHQENDNDGPDEPSVLELLAPTEMEG